MCAAENYSKTLNSLRKVNVGFLCTCSNTKLLDWWKFGLSLCSHLRSSFPCLKLSQFLIRSLFFSKVESVEKAVLCYKNIRTVTSKCWKDKYWHRYCSSLYKYHCSLVLRDPIKFQCSKEWIELANKNQFESVSNSKHIITVRVDWRRRYQHRVIAVTCHFSWTRIYWRRRKTSVLRRNSSAGRKNSSRKNVRSCWTLLPSSQNRCLLTY